MERDVPVDGNIQNVSSQKMKQVMSSKHYLGKEIAKKAIKSEVISSAPWLKSVDKPQKPNIPGSGNV